MRFHAILIIDWEGRDYGWGTGHVLAAPRERPNAAVSGNATADQARITASHVTANSKVFIFILDLEVFVPTFSVEGGDLEVFEVAHEARAEAPQAAVVTTSRRLDGPDVMEVVILWVSFFRMRNLPVATVAALGEDARMPVPKGLYSVGVVGPRATAAKHGDDRVSA